MNREEFLYFNSKLPISKARLIRGPTGIGKSCFVRDYAEAVKKKLIVLDLSLYDPPDLIGMPYIEKCKTVYAEPWWWPTEPAILLIEEIDNCDDDLQSPAMLLALDRIVGGKKLHDETVVFATGNGDKYKRNTLDQALMRRFAVVDYKPTVPEWLEWARKQKSFSAQVLDYIDKTPEALDTPEELVGKPGQSIPCRASWSDFGFFLESLGNETDKVALWAAPFIGAKAADQFALWLLFQKKSLLVGSIFSGRVRVADWSPVEITNASTAVADTFLKRNQKEQENALGFYASAGAEQFACLFNRLPKSAAPIVASVKPAADLADELVRISLE